MIDNRSAQHCIQLLQRSKVANPLMPIMTRTNLAIQCSARDDGADPCLVKMWTWKRAMPHELTKSNDGLIYSRKSLYLSVEKKKLFWCFVRGTYKKVVGTCGASIKQKFWLQPLDLRDDRRWRHTSSLSAASFSEEPKPVK